MPNAVTFEVNQGSWDLNAHQLGMCINPTFNNHTVPKMQRADIPNGLHYEVW